MPSAEAVGVTVSVSHMGDLGVSKGECPYCTGYSVGAPTWAHPRSPLSAGAAEWPLMECQCDKEGKWPTPGQVGDKANRVYNSRVVQRCHRQNLLRRVSG
jgi:hypothetical protein